MLLGFILLLCTSFLWLKYDNQDLKLKDYPRLADTVRLKQDLLKITQTPRPRHYRNPDILDSVAAYIHAEMSKWDPSVSEQKFEVQGRNYKNIIASFGPADAQRIIVGAHYDVCGDQEGADDNASGVAGLLELARLLKDQPLKYRFDLVAYTLEEPPFFRTENMGSFVHAKSLNDNKIAVKGMVCLEMIGYFDEKQGSQDYPLGFLKWIYGSKGDFITVVENMNSGSFAKEFRRNLLKEQTIRTKKFKAPARLPGIDFSDHRNYWQFGYSAVMITNTAFYRNKNYHQKTDKVETLDIGRMGLVVDGVFRALILME
jgi:Peptidase family M28